MSDCAQSPLRAPVNSSGAFNSTIGFQDKPRTFTFFFTYTTLSGGTLTYQMNQGLDVTRCLFSLDKLYNNLGEVAFSLLPGIIFANNLL
jgi:hypothetical protein